MPPTARGGTPCAFEHWMAHGFDAEEIKEVVALQKQTYILLRWIEGSLQTQSLSPRVAHHTMSLWETAERWLARHYHELPVECRPNRKDLPRFARLFASYLESSFDFISKPPRKIYCECRWCTAIQPGRHFKPKKLTKRDRAQATQLKRIYIEELATSMGLQGAPDVQSQALNTRELASHLSWAAYGAGLLRRSKTYGYGPGALVLWRELAWKGSGPKRKFKLSAERMIEAQRTISAFLTNRSESRV